MNVQNVNSGFKVKPKFKFFGQYCDVWINFMSEYQRQITWDWPFWYGERPLVGLLAAAIWNSGGICLEEYKTDKKAGKEDDEAYAGRGDLYIFNGKNWDGNIEFKKHDIPITTTDHIPEFLSSKWLESELDGRKFKQEGVNSLGGMFLRPFIGTKRDMELYKANIGILLNLIWDKVEPDVLAWWCPNETLDMAMKAKNSKNWVIGVVLIIKQVDPSPN